MLPKYRAQILPYSDCLSTFLVNVNHVYVCSLTLKLDIVQGVSLPNEECSVDSLEMEDINQVSDDDEDDHLYNEIEDDDDIGRGGGSGDGDEV